MAQPAHIRGRQVPMRVIVCGLHRTGTLSMRHALYMLGYHDVHHMYNVFGDPSTAEGWTRAIKAKYSPGGKPFTRADWDELLGDCQSCVDVPTALFGPELAAAYPEAKVVIMSREPEAWYKSVLTNIAPQLNPPLGVKIVSAFCRLFDPVSSQMHSFLAAVNNLGFAGFKWTEKDKSIAWFHAMYKEYRDNIPEDRRMEFTVKDGWGPLCKFLDVPIPKAKDEKTGVMKEVPFPRMNDQEQFSAFVGKWKKNNWDRATKNLLALVGASALVGVAVWGVSQYVSVAHIMACVQG